MNKWRIVKLKEVAKLDRRSVSPEKIKSGTCYLGLENIESGGRIIEYQIVKNRELKSSKFRFTDDHILYGKLRPYLAKISLPDFHGVCSTDIIPILPGTGIIKEYLFYYLKQGKMVDYANSRSSGANLPRLSPKELANFEIPLPPLEEQKRIARILDTADEIRAKRRQSIGELDRLAQSVFLDMFGDPVTNPKGWDYDDLGNICDVRDGTHDSPKYVHDGYPLLTSKNFKNGIIDFNSANKISKEDFFKINKRSKVDIGDIVMPMIGTIGNPVIVDIEPDFAIKNVALIKFNNKLLLNIFILYLLRSHYFQYVTSNSNRGGTQKFIALRDIRGLQIPIPPIEILESFKKVIQIIDDQKKLNHQHLTELDNLFASLQSRAFNGTL